MTSFETYTLILCLIVFVLLVGVFAYMLSMILKQEFRQIRAGLEDRGIIKEYNSFRTRGQSKFFKVLGGIFNTLVCLAFVAAFALSLYINNNQNVYLENVPTYRVVMTSSMESKNEKNEYLFENNLDDQIGTFDLIPTYQIPPEDELELYDIVVYDIEGTLIVHRIVGIEEPNASHPDERYFLLQGDAVSSPDRFPVHYSQMRGIYRGGKIPYVGSFVLFMQSPVGFLCMALVLAAFIITPILEKKLAKARKERHEYLSGIYY